MIPVADVIRPRTTPWITTALVLVNGALFACLVTLPPGAAAHLLERFAFVPAVPSLTSATAAMFLHESVLHLASNALVLLVFGPNVEDQLGRLRYAAFLALTGYAGWLAEVWGAPDSLVPLVGPAGAAAGVIGAYFMMFPRSRVLVLVPATTVIDAVEVPAILPVAIWFALQVVGGLGRLSEPFLAAAGVPVWPYAGGFVVGGLAVRLLRRPERRRVEWWGA